MIEISTSQGRRIPRRRNSRSANQRNTALSSYFNLPGSTTSRSAGTTSLPFDQHTTPAQYSEQAATSGFFNFLDFGSPSPELLGAGASIHHDGQVDSSWASSWIGLNGSASVDQVAPQLADANNISLLQDAFPPQIPSPNLQLSWDFSATNPRHASSDMSDASMLETQLGSYGSFEYVTSSPNTLTSPISDGWVIPSSSNSLYGSPASPRSKHHLIQDLQLPGDYFQNVTSPNASLPSPVNAGSPLYPDMFSFEETRAGSLWTGEGDSSAWSTTNNIMTSQAPSSTFTYPWNSQDAQDSSIFGPNSHSGSVAFDPERGGPYHTFDTRKEVLAANTNSNTTTGGSVTPEVLTPGSDTPSYEDTNKELQDRISSRSRSGSPWQYIAEHHSHIFSVRSGIEKAKPQRGRMRPLTVKGKKEALEVRNAGACWACHLSKVKCSPCSSGSPCEQCARLLGKRRFCHLPCFNDPIESLNTFLVPDYLTGHFTQQNVESFVQKHAVGWGSHSFRVCMTWGGRIPLVANVVALTLREDRSELSNNSQAVYDDNDRPILVRKNSPPLGIPLAAMNEMQDEYSRYVQDLVKTDLDRYVSTAYDDQQSDLPRRLLQAICMFHKAGVEVDDESDMGDMIRLALEMHVTCTILERSLILERESINLVSHYLQQEYPARTAARCAQRQIKLAFFIAQRQRIVEVLRKWGSLMWATTGTSAASANNGHKWVTSFSVFLLLILVMDKTLIAAYYFCEGEIKHHGREATTERRKQASLMRLMQTELFERCKEVFHSRFKTRKAGKESCNPVRDGWKGRDMELREVRLVRELQHIVLDFDDEIKAQRASSTTRRGESDEIRYDDAGRLASIFLGDFLNL